MKDAACLDVVLLSYSLFVISLDEGLAAVALSETDLTFEGTDGYGQGLVVLQERVGCY